MLYRKTAFCSPTPFMAPSTMISRYLLSLIHIFCAVRISFLDIPEENTLHYLSGKVIKLKDPQIVKQFDGLDKSRQEAVDVS